MRYATLGTVMMCTLAVACGDDKKKEASEPHYSGAHEPVTELDQITGYWQLEHEKVGEASRALSLLSDERSLMHIDASGNVSRIGGEAYAGACSQVRSARITAPYEVMLLPSGACDELRWTGVRLPKDDGESSKLIIEIAADGQQSARQATFVRADAGAIGHALLGRAPGAQPAPEVFAQHAATAPTEDLTALRSELVETLFGAEIEVVMTAEERFAGQFGTDEDNPIVVPTEAYASFLDGAVVPRDDEASLHRVLSAGRAVCALQQVFPARRYEVVRLRQEIPATADGYGQTWTVTPGEPLSGAQVIDLPPNARDAAFAASLEPVEATEALSGRGRNLLEIVVKRVDSDSEDNVEDTASILCYAYRQFGAIDLDAVNSALGEHLRVRR